MKAGKSKTPKSWFYRCALPLNQGLVQALLGAMVDWRRGCSCTEQDCHFEELPDFGIPFGGAFTCQDAIDSRIKAVVKGDFGHEVPPIHDEVRPGRDAART